MKFYEKPMAIINRFEVEDIIAASSYEASAEDMQTVIGESYTGEGAQKLGVVFQW